MALWMRRNEGKRSQPVPIVVLIIGLVFFLPTFMEFLDTGLMDKGTFFLGGGGIILGGALFGAGLVRALYLKKVKPQMVASLLGAAIGLCIALFGYVYIYSAIAEMFRHL